MTLTVITAFQASSAELTSSAPASPESIALEQTSSLAATYTNPVLSSDFPDPFVLRVGATYYAYATNGGGNTIQLATSSDLVSWVYAGDAFGSLPGWAEPGWTWAPEVAEVPGGYAMYYTARHAESARQCVGVAFSTNPEGPFTDTSSEPLVCQLDQGGSIDASPFTDRDGQRYLYWKNDGNCCGLPTYLYVQRLSSDGLKLVGEAKALIYNTDGWEGNLIEAPTIYRRGDKYYLFFSAADYGNETYAVGYAYGFSPTGPFTKWKNNPVLKTAGRVAGPGHQCVITDDAGTLWMLYHAWETGNTGYPNGQRTLHLDRVNFKDGVPVIKPTTSRQTAPALTQKK
ncbi:MAG: family 43 glycosylhydrolase [Pleurocapsa sp. SU_196_0]|nr:family 43 glycosylhydrolase [Pleurocapsa sp. SU_196_0]